MPPDLWRFAETFYRRPGVENACLRLQAQGADVCLLICAVWLQRQQTACQPSRIEALRSLAQPWQQEVVQPLRQLRQGWRLPSQSDQPLAQLREQLKRLELQAERELLQRLAALSQSWLGDAGAEPQPWLQRLAPAHAEREALQLLQRMASAGND